MQAQPLIDGLAFAEAPRWHDGALWFSDFFLGQVLRLDDAGRAQVMAEVPNQPSGLGWDPQGRLLVVSMTDRRLLRQQADGTLATVADLMALAPWHCNDMVVDARGGAYIGNFGFDLFAQPRVPRNTTLVYVAPDGAARVVADELMFPNGAVITPDGRTLILAETHAQRLTAFDIAADGALSGRRLWAALDDAYPDGICLDAEGAVWVASPRKRAFLRVAEGGRVLHKVHSPLPAIACALGGADGRRLFMVQGKVLAREAALAERCSRIDFIDVDTPAASAAGAAP